MASRVDGVEYGDQTLGTRRILATNVRQAQPVVIHYATRTNSVGLKDFVLAAFDPAWVSDVFLHLFV
jgi:hypothetical protein